MIPFPFSSWTFYFVYCDTIIAFCTSTAVEIVFSFGPGRMTKRGNPISYGFKVQNFRACVLQVDAIPGISPSPTEFIPVITWITPGDSGYLQAPIITRDWTVRAHPTRQESLPDSKPILGSHLSPTAPIFRAATNYASSPS